MLLRLTSHAPGWGRAPIALVVLQAGLTHVLCRPLRPRVGRAVLVWVLSVERGEVVYDHAQGSCGARAFDCALERSLFSSVVMWNLFHVWSKGRERDTIHAKKKIVLTDTDRDTVYALLSQVLYHLT